MIAAPFALHRPRSAGEAAALLAEAGPDASVLGGGTVLVPEMSAGRARPRVVVDLGRAGLGRIVQEGHDLVVGATVTYADLERHASMAPEARLLSRVAGLITGGAQIRNRATPAGSAAYGNPSSDVPAVLVALDARVRLLSTAGQREVPAAEFFSGAFKTARRPDELVVALVIPQTGDGRRFGYYKLKFGESSWPILTATAVALPEGTSRAVVGGLATTPLSLRGGGDDLPAALAGLAGEPWSDVLADAGYRRAVAPAVVARAWRDVSRGGSPAASA